jgi:hypothetical protein
MTIILLKKMNGYGVGAVLNVRPDVGNKYIKAGLARKHFIDWLNLKP